VTIKANKTVAAAASKPKWTKVCLIACGVVCAIILIFVGIGMLATKIDVKGTSKVETLPSAPLVPNAATAQRAEPVNQAKIKRKLAELLAGEKELQREDVEGRLLFWEQIVALAPDNAEYTKQRDAIKNEAAELEVFRDNPELGAQVVSVRGRKEAFGAVMVMDITIRNRSLSNLKDFTLTCKSMGPSGSVIGQNSNVLYEVVPARSTKTFKGVNMGFIHPQATRASCEVDEAQIG
jgi:hypothetical protein